MTLSNDGDEDIINRERLLVGFVLRQEIIERTIYSPSCRIVAAAASSAAAADLLIPSGKSRPMRLSL